MSNKRYFGSATFANGRVDMGKVKHLEDVTSFAQLVKEVIADPVMSSLTRAQFLALPKKDAKAPNDQSRAKQIAYIVPGSYPESTVPRDGSHVPKVCHLIILDIDQGSKGNYPARRFVDDPQQLQSLLSPYAFVAYTTASSTTEAPKLRVIVSADSITSDDYPRAVHFVAGRLGLGEGDFDKVSTEVTRAMYRPVAYRGEQVDPILDAAPEGQDVTEVDLSDTELPQPKRRSANETDDIEFLKAPLEGFTIADAVDALSHLDPDMGYNQWLELCMSLKHQFPREPESTEALEAFDMWSAGARQKYEGREVTQAKWDAVNVTAKGRAPRTIRSLIHYAEEAGWSSSSFSKRSFTTVSDWLHSALRTGPDLISDGVKKIAAAHLDSPIERDILLGLLQKRLSELNHGTTKNVLRKQLDAITRTLKVNDSAITSLPESQLPTWARGIVYVSETNEFYQRSTDKAYNPETLNNNFNVFLNPNPDTAKAPVEAKDYMLNIAKCPRVSNYMYSPKHFDQPIVKLRGKKFINTYQSSYPEADRSDMAAGELIARHIALLIKEPEYQTLLIDFFAYHVQFPGNKVRYAPVIQGAQGCGKTALFMMMQGVLGADNAKSVNAETLMNSSFTSWATGCQIRAIEEVRVVGENRHAVMNKLKPYITNNEIEVNKKFKDEISVPNCTNYIMFTNHHDALAVQEGDRRYFVLQCTLQTKAAVAAIGEAYFNELFHAIQFRAAGIRAWLEAWTISPFFNPDGHAPETPYLRDMVDASASPLSAAVREIVNDQDHPLIQPDLLSTYYINERVKAAGLNCHQSVLASILREMGYERVGRLSMGDDKHNIWAKHGSEIDWRREANERYNKIGSTHFDNENLL